MSKQNIQVEPYLFELTTISDSEVEVSLKEGYRYKQSDISLDPPIGYVYFQGPHDASPEDLWPNSTWTDVSYEEANLVRRPVGSLTGAFFNGTPARFSVSVASGVPTITVVSGGAGYMSGGSGNLALVIVGSCTKQMVANATVANGVLTAINVTTAGAGYTSGAVAVYDGVVGHGDLTQKITGAVTAPNRVGFSTANGAFALNSDYAQRPSGGVDSYPSGFTFDSSRVVRAGNETSGAWVVVKKWRRTA